jgi:hypothetical protein
MGSRFLRAGVSDDGRDARGALSALLPTGQSFD